MEYHSGVIWRIDGFDVGQQRARTILIVDRIDTVEGELDIGRSQVVTIGELQARLDLNGEFSAVAAPSTVIRSNVRRQFRGVVILCIQEREHVDLNGIGTVVIGAGRVNASNLVCGADGNDIRIPRCGTAIFYSAACRERGQRGNRNSCSDNLLVIHYGILSLPAVVIGTPKRRAIRVGHTLLAEHFTEVHFVTLPFLDPAKTQQSQRFCN